MIFLQALWARIWPYVAALGAAFAAALAIRQSGKAAARAEDAAKLNETAAKARKEARDEENKVAAMDDTALLDAAGEWVRNKSDRH